MLTIQGMTNHHKSSSLTEDSRITNLTRLVVDHTHFNYDGKF